MPVIGSGTGYLPRPTFCRPIPDFEQVGRKEKWQSRKWLFGWSKEELGDHIAKLKSIIEDRETSVTS